MIAEAHLSRRRLFQRLKNGSHGQLIERYAVRLVEVGLARDGILRSLKVVSDLLSWITRSRSVLKELDEGMVERYFRHRARKHSIKRGDRAALKRWLSVLRDAGMIVPSSLAPITPQDHIFAEFSDSPFSRHCERQTTPNKSLGDVRRCSASVCQ